MSGVLAIRLMTECVCACLSVCLFAYLPKSSSTEEIPVDLNGSERSCLHVIPLVYLQPYVVVRSRQREKRDCDDGRLNMLIASPSRHYSPRNRFDSIGREHTLKRNARLKRRKRSLQSCNVIQACRPSECECWWTFVSCYRVHTHFLISFPSPHFVRNLLLI